MFVYIYNFQNYSADFDKNWYWESIQISGGGNMIFVDIDHPTLQRIETCVKMKKNYSL
jgi:hypothetical protein